MALSLSVQRQSSPAPSELPPAAALMTSFDPPAAALMTSFDPPAAALMTSFDPPVAALMTSVNADVQTQGTITTYRPVSGPRRIQGRPAWPGRHCRAGAQQSTRPVSTEQTHFDSTNMFDGVMFVLPPCSPVFTSFFIRPQGLLKKSHSKKLRNNLVR